MWQQKAHFIVRWDIVKAQEEGPQLGINTDTNYPRPEGNDIPPMHQTMETEQEIEPPMQQANNEGGEEQAADVAEGNQVHEGVAPRRSGRTRRPPTHLQDYITSEQGIEQAVQASMANITESDFKADIVAYETLHSPLHENVCEQDPLTVAMKSVMDPDTLYLWEARKEPDFLKFLEAMQKEVDDHTREGHWRLVRKKDVPKGATVLPAVWSMKRKRRIATREVYKWKACINIDGSKQVYGVHYNETYSPVVAWPMTRFFLTQSLLNNWTTKQIDFVLAFPQAPVERDLYMEIPKGIHVEGAKDGEEYVLQLVRNLYGQSKPAVSGTNIW
jgi:hypothetical protein